MKMSNFCLYDKGASKAGLDALDISMARVSGHRGNRLGLLAAFGLSLILAMLCFAPRCYSHGDISKFPPAVQILQYKMILYMNPNDLENRNKLAMAYWLDNKLDDAQRELTKVMEKDHKNFNAIDGMGMVLFKRGDFKGALEYFNRAAAIRPDDLLVHVHKALTYERLNQKEKAKEEMAKAKSLAKDQKDQQKIQREIKLMSKS